MRCNQVQAFPRQSTEEMFGSGDSYETPCHGDVKREGEGTTFSQSPACGRLHEWVKARKRIVQVELRRCNCIDHVWGLFGRDVKKFSNQGLRTDT